MLIAIGLLRAGDKILKVNTENISLLFGIASSIRATPKIILIVAFDAPGEKTIVQLERLLVSLRVTDFDASLCIGKLRFEGNKVDASKLSQIVAKGLNVESTARRKNRSKNAIRVGVMI